MLNGDTAAKTSSDDDDVRMIVVHAIKQNKCVGNERGFRWLAGAAAVAAVVERIKRAPGKCVGERRRAARKILGIAAKVDGGIWTRG
jgi:hypothetical protein